jgi:hypothetical protein
MTYAALSKPRSPFTGGPTNRVKVGMARLGGDWTDGDEHNVSESLFFKICSEYVQSIILHNTPHKLLKHKNTFGGGGGN